MGGQVRLALNVAAFPETLPLNAIEEVLSAAAEVVAQAGGVVAGGHTIRSEEPIFGLAVQGIVHPDWVWTKGGASPGDVLVLSKPLGTGIVLAGGSEEDRTTAIGWMRTLNRDAADQLRMLDGGPHACTDVTGYGLLGHGWEMAERSGATVVLNAQDLPMHHGALAAAEAGTRTGGDARNRAAMDGKVHIAGQVDAARAAIGFDPQTSGGLLAAVAPKGVADLVDQGWSVVGDVEAGPIGVVLR